MKISEENIVIKIEDSDIIDGVLSIEGVDVVGAYSGANFSDLIEIDIKPDVRVIGLKAFENCVELEKVTLPESLIKIGKEAFSACQSLEEISIPSKITSLESGIFEDCIRLRKVNLPKGLIKIDENAFANCESLVDINFPESLQAIDSSVFDGCISLKKIQIPDNVRNIGSGAFLGCKNLTEVTLPKNLKVIESGVFESCENLENIIIPKDVKIIYASAFEECSALKEIELPDQLETIEQAVFENCESLTNITLPKNLVSLGKNCFKDCYGLTNITIPNKVKHIEYGCFQNCLSLKEVSLGEKVEEICEDAFINCSLLERINIPKNVTKIQKFAFADCSALKEIEIEKAVVAKNAFANCELLDKIELGSDSKYCDTAPKSIRFITKKGQRFYLTSEEIDETSFNIENSNLNVETIIALWEERHTLNLKNKNAKLYNAMSENLDKEQFAHFYKTANVKFFGQIEKQLGDFVGVSYKAFCKMYYNLGGFAQPFTEKKITKSGNEVEREIDYAQKVCEFIKERLAENSFFNPKIIAKCFNRTRADGMKREFTDFMLEENNFMEMIQKGASYVTQVYNEFEIIQKLNTSKKGRQRKLKPTFKIFNEYINRKQFEGVTEENKNLAEVISRFYMRQKFFEEALSILDQWEKEAGNKQILDNPVIDPCDRLDNLEKIINFSAKDTITTVGNDIFSYEWLDKNDPYNFVLGKLCQCCAYLEGVGYGIMKASIVHPDIQNLVVKKNGEIVAKATTYVNKEEGYALLNTAEVTDEVEPSKKSKVYDKLKEGVQDFVKEYNKENPKAPIKIVNIGMGNNRLASYIRINGKKAKDLLPSPVYAIYGKEGLIYNADSNYDQYTIWEKE